MGEFMQQFTFAQTQLNSVSFIVIKVKPSRDETQYSSENGEKCEVVADIYVPVSNSLPVVLAVKVLCTVEVCKIPFHSLKRSPEAHACIYLS
jgi:hypothetical protein